jgi:hypothetical protein
MCTKKVSNTRSKKQTHGWSDEGKNKRTNKHKENLTNFSMKTVVMLNAPFMYTSS